MLISRTRNSQCPPFLLNGTQIEKVSHFKYLGILPHMVQTHRKKCLLQGTKTSRIYVSHFLLHCLFCTHIKPKFFPHMCYLGPHISNGTRYLQKIRIATKSCTSQSSSFLYKLPSLNRSDSIINYFIPLNPTKCLVQPLAKTVSYFFKFFLCQLN